MLILNISYLDKQIKKLFLILIIYNQQEPALKEQVDFSLFEKFYLQDITN